ncbi:MAG: SDR family oxidoreductase [Dehalococcoidales bacterium]|nr:SDR family oxidoreductase [Dehalococcoidales bacterium]
MDFQLDNKVAMVTGASSGIGLACAELLATSGAKVAMIARNPERLRQAVEVVREKGTATEYRLDVADVAAINPIVSEIREELGEIDILVCSAGVNVTKPAHEFTEDDWDNILSINTKGLFFCNQTVAVQSMIPRKGGVIVNIASQMGLVGGQNRAVYCASKGGVIQLTRAEAIDWAPYNIRVNAVAPTFVQTAMTENMLKDPENKAWIMENILFDRVLTAEEVAAAVCFLASDEAAMITGTALPIDGGWTAK